MTTPVPRSGDDTYDLIDDALAALAERRGAWLGDELAAMALLASLIEQAERWLPHLVHDARANQHTGGQSGVIAVPQVGQRNGRRRAR